jgi:hypothetical protein
MLLKEPRDVAVERTSARQELEEDHAEGIEVGSGVDRLSEHLLGRHVLGRTQRLAYDGERLHAGLRVRRFEPRDAEVEQLDEVALSFVLDQHDVLGFEVAVDDPFFMSRAYPGRDALHDRDGAGWFHGTGRELVTKIASNDELEDEKERPVRRAPEVGRMHDVRVLDARRSDRFAFEARDDLRVTAQIGVQKLQGEDFARLHILDPVHRAHGAFADRRDDSIPRPDDGACRDWFHVPPHRLARRPAGGRGGVKRARSGWTAGAARDTGFKWNSARWT